MSGVGVGERIFSAEQINVPGDLPAILKEYTKAVLVANPPDVHQFSAECVSASNHCLRLALSLWLPLLCAPGRRARDVPHRFPSPFTPQVVREEGSRDSCKAGAGTIGAQRDDLLAVASPLSSARFCSSRSAWGVC
jgi:hypothetical protein